MTNKADDERKKISRETLGKYFYDLSKTCFASFVVANIIAIFTVSNILVPIGLLTFGTLSTAGLAWIGYSILNK